ncbi:UMP kinase [Chlamydia gallinacea]|uniref:Uridylate kinase n=2 Tax=Chlamydia gallinacea TaxID=1457153 RepID=A0A173DYW6_9CHLA|nr:UMP kinase [Chlamydia gallinacea]EYE60575.1 UMP kinase [Bacteroides fragilis str. S6L5]ANG66118.1 UMP kinase [Chlamydia gallinacea 08-1274/3]AQT77664.1 UMP kinase [Chlamydia gallinacea]MBX6679973.1 UMP kinase [Chlamydia gallinacea]MBX6687205.1 UMP kinase [Chlamydia gallinacea]
MSKEVKRVLFKISGESLATNEDGSNRIDEIQLSRLVGELRDVRKCGVEVAVVVGGGNIIRGLDQQKMLQINRVSADQMGMLATLINGMALSDALKADNIPCLLTSTLSCPQLAELYTPQKSSEALKQGKILICTTGAGSPYLTTDTGAALRACELNVDVLFKATMHVDGVYDKDPRVDKDAVRYDAITFKDFLSQQLGVMDPAAISLCMEANIPIRVFNFAKHSLKEVLLNEYVGTLIHSGEDA